MAAHSHHLWPDASFAGQQQAWDDAARLADDKWDKVMGEVWPEAQHHVVSELGLPDPATIVFASNTHDLFVRLVSATRRRPLRVLASDGEFHSFRRQAARWVESGTVQLETVATDGADFAGRFVERASALEHDLIFVSQIMFESGSQFDRLEDLAALSHPEGPWVVIDGYHAFMAIASNLGPVADRLFYLAGGYKYAMAGEGAAFMHAPPGYSARPEISGWYAAFDELALKTEGVSFPADARRFLGATFDPSGLYRFNAVQRMLAEQGLTTKAINDHVDPLRETLLERIGDTALGSARLLNPPGPLQARFLALHSPAAAQWHAELAAMKVVTDVRGDVIRIGLGLYHSADDIDRFAEAARQLSPAT